MNHPLRDILAWLTISLIVSIALLVVIALVDFPGAVSKLLIVVVGGAFAGSLVVDKEWASVTGFLLGYIPMVLFVFTKLGEPVALWLISLFV